MASQNNDKAVLPVLCNSDEHTVFSVGVSASLETIPEEYRKNIVTFQPTSDTYVFLERTEQDLNAPTVTDGDANRGRLLKAGESYDFYIPENRTRLRIIGTTGSLHLYRSSR